MPGARALRERLMGTEVLAVAPPAEAARVFAQLREAERIFSRFRPGSDLSRANAAAGGEPVRVSPLLLAVLGEAIGYQRRTGGLFSPFLGADLQRLGYAADFAALDPGGVPEPAPPGPGPDPAAPVRIDHDRGTLGLPAGLALDLGGFVKGWSVQRAAEDLRAPRALIDAGGDLVALRGPEGPPWRVGVAHPLRERPVGVLELPPVAAVATSSVARRAWRTANGRPLHHIVDPRTGEPADSDCLQATVLLDDLAAAEVYATCLTILGTENGPAWLARRDPAAAWITVDRAGGVRHSPGLPLEAP
ncbi:FAD:protein FMN transferase [Streptomyces sp. DSM 44917]|uniref:FAD:protein FMN transferase n=1 Tax=Streptomyces boetiae TaxID=3075541 RepID=A0ABU2L4E6_9ACTN|nr:FAD:protein FMN transferase [Streptomyces sp. DSM 44917]MDT0306434.1 FAD:protein FMN transferase [Streptomyces sp. DSM 44917]